MNLITKKYLYDNYKFYKNKKKFIKENFYILCITNFFNWKFFSETIKKFNINGNERVSDETVIMFTKLNVGDNINQNILNNTIKELYKTNYFKNIFLTNENGIIVIDLVENPIIQSITINGIKDNKIIENIKKVSSKLEKYPFVENKINEQTILLKIF